jgi:hypothetical protein
MIFTVLFVFFQSCVSLARSIRGIIYRHQSRTDTVLHE